MNGIKDVSAMLLLLLEEDRKGRCSEVQRAARRRRQSTCLQLTKLPARQTASLSHTTCELRDTRGNVWLHGDAGQVGLVGGSKEHRSSKQETRDRFPSAAVRRNVHPPFTLTHTATQEAVR